MPTPRVGMFRGGTYGMATRGVAMAPNPEDRMNAVTTNGG